MGIVVLLIGIVVFIWVTSLAAQSESMKPRCKKHRWESQVEGGHVCKDCGYISGSD
jgi:hypothetical protein